MKLTKKEVKPLLDMSFPDYTGRKFTLRRATRCHAQLYWSEGSKDELVALAWDGERFVKSVAADIPPFNGGDVNFDIPKNVVIVNRVYFGSSQWITFLVHPENEMIQKVL